MLPAHPFSVSSNSILSFWCERSITYHVFRVNSIKIIHCILQSHSVHSQHSAQEYPRSLGFFTVTCDTIFLCRFSAVSTVYFLYIDEFFLSVSALSNVLFLPWFYLETFLYLLHKQTEADRFRSASVAQWIFYFLPIPPFFISDRTPASGRTQSVQSPACHAPWMPLPQQPVRSSRPMHSDHLRGLPCMR